MLSGSALQLGSGGAASTGAVWATAAFGIAGLYIARPDRHWPRVLTYVVMGWLASRTSMDAP